MVPASLRVNISTCSAATLRSLREIRRNQSGDGYRILLPPKKLATIFRGHLLPSVPRGLQVLEHPTVVDKMAIVPYLRPLSMPFMIKRVKCASRRTLDFPQLIYRPKTLEDFLQLVAPTQRPEDGHFPRVRRVVDVLGHRRLRSVIRLDLRIVSRIIYYHRSRLRSILPVLLHLRPGGRSGAPTIVKNAFSSEVPKDHIFTVPQLTQTLNPPGTGWRAPRCRARTPVRTQPPRSIHLPPPQPRNPSTTAQTHPPEPQPQPQRRPDCTGRSS